MRIFSHYREMIKSMTGYGRAEKTFDKYKISVEIKSVNNRYLDTNIKLYRQYSFVEEIARECICAALSRGKVDVYIQIDTAVSDDTTVIVNEALAKKYADAISGLCDSLHIENDVKASTLCGFSDVFCVEKEEQDKDALGADARSVILEALDDLKSNREREGQRLKKFFDDCIVGVKDILGIIKERSPKTVDEYRQRIKDRVDEYLNGVETDESRLLTEVAIFSDKVNITEEIIRFESHLKEFSLLLVSDAPVGRKLDFIIQELNREANTMGSKCNDYTLSKAVVDLKSEIEKLREQIQNIE